MHTCKNTLMFTHTVFTVKHCNPQVCKLSFHPEAVHETSNLCEEKMFSRGGMPTLNRGVKTMSCSHITMFSVNHTE